MTSDPRQPDAPQPTPGGAEPAAAFIEYATPGRAEPPVAGIEYATPGRTNMRWPYDEPAGWSWPLLLFAWLIGGAAAVAGLAAVISAVLGFRVYAVAVPVALLVLVSVAAVLRSVRRGQAMAVLAYLEQAVRLNLPLPDLLTAAALAERGALRRRLMTLRHRLETGEPIGDGLARSLSGLPYRTVAMVQAAERSGCLAQVLRRVVDQERSARRADSAARTDSSSVLFFRWYPLVLALSVSLACFLFGTFVAPKYMQLFKDFGLPVPPLTRWVLDLTPWLIVVVVACGLVLLARVAGLFGELFTPRLVRINPLLTAADPLLWHLPPARGVVRSRGLADVCHAAADALERGHTLDRALGEASTQRVNSVLRRRLRVWADLAGQGQPPADAARLAGMPPLVTGMLATARSGEDGANAMRFLARYYEGRFSRAAHFVRAAATPLLALVFGGIVAVIALAQFLPMVRLMDKLSGGFGRVTM
jgi:type II secretory pathway component PulF